MKVRFFGAVGEVTGSCFLVETAASRLLVDCGLFQGNRTGEARNREPFPFKPADIDAVVLTHAHLDHSGRIPLLVRDGFRGPVYAQRACIDLCRILLLDSAHLAEKDAEHENRRRARKGRRPVEPLYGRRDAELALKQFRAVDYLAPHSLLPGIDLTLHDAGHILGSAIAELTLTENGKSRRIVFSGDLGHAGAPILRDPQHLTAADFVVMESTYGDRAHRGWDQTWDELGSVFRDAEGARGNILIPAFAIGRSQELLYAFQRHYREWGLDRWAVFLDSPMAIEATDVYARHWKLYDRDATQLLRRRGNAFGLPNLHFTRTPLQSTAINRIQSGAIIIAGSGMCDGGRIRHHLKHNIWREHSHVVFVGYQASGTLGRAIVDGAKQIRLWNETMRVSAQIHTIGGLSAHADQNGLMSWYRHFRNRPPVALVHGEPAAATALSARLRRDVNATVHIPAPGSVLDLSDSMKQTP